MKRKLKYPNIILVIIALTVFCINLSIYLNKYLVPNYNENDKDNDNVSEENIVQTEEKKNEEELKKLQAMGERDRIQYYFGKYIRYIQDEKYEEAYDLLYPEYKDTYFPTIEDYVKYVQEKYSFSTIAVEYNNIERNGEIYVLWVSIVDPINGNPEAEDKLEQKIVIKENDFNDFVLSFSV